MGAPPGKTNVPAAAPALVGRAAEQAAIARFFDEGARVVTLLGPGGVGKTRLAIAFATAHAAAYAAHGGGGAWLCDLTDARSAMAIAAVVAGALGVRLDPAVGEARVLGELGRALARRRRLLLVLDNCEHVAAHAAAAIAAWQPLAPQLRCLVTSRSALGVPGEQLWPLAGLAASEATDLFVRRARQVRPDLPLAAEELAAIAEIVRRLDGLPLAIELAAARTRVLSARQIRDRLALELLVQPGEAGRHASMRGVVLDSVQALAAEARTAFAGCALFRGGFALAAAEAVLAAPGRDVLGVLDALCACSLLRTTTSPELGAPRFQLFEPVREVAAELLGQEPAARAQLAARHAQYFAAAGHALARRADAHADRAALAELAAELENLVDAHAHALAAGAPDGPALALTLALALDPLLAMRGLFRLRLRLLDGAIAAADGAPAPDGLLAAAFLARGQAHRELSFPERARDDLGRGLALAVRAGDSAAAALAELQQGELVEVDGATGEARGYYARALARLAAAPASPLVRIRQAEAYAALGHAWRREGELAAADHAIAEALARFRAADHQPGAAAMLYEAAVVALFREEHDAAKARLAEALALARALHARQLEAAITSGLGVALQATGELDAALAHHTAAVEVFRDLGNRHREGSALYYLAGAYLERGELLEARTLLEQAAAAIAAIGANRYRALIAGARGAALALADEPAAAAAAFAEAAAAAAACHSEPALTATLAIHRAHLDRSPAALAAARALVAATPGDDPRLALRILERPRSARPGAALVIRAGALAFRAPGARADVDLSRRHVLRRLVAALAEHRAQAPGTSLGFDELLAAGWPGERIAQAAAVNRVHVALTTLRNLGLRGLLVSDDRGYLLDPAVAIVRA